MFITFKEFKKLTWLLLFVSLFLLRCTDNQYIGKAALPTFDPAPGTYTYVPFTVTIETATEGSAIYFTTDGSTPLPDGAELPNTRRIVFDWDGQWAESVFTVKAIAAKPGMWNSDIAEAVYTLILPPREQIETPVISPQGGSYSATLEVEITCATPGAQIHYTWNADGENSDGLYAAPLVLPVAFQSMHSITAHASIDGMADSYLAESWYTFTYHWEPLAVGYTLRDTYQYDSTIIVVGDGGVKLRQTCNAPNPSAWELIPSGTTNDIFAIIRLWFGEYRIFDAPGMNAVATKGVDQDFVSCVVGNSGAITYDGVAVDSGTTADLNAIWWDGYSFFAVGDAGTILSSTSGETWIQRDSGTSENLNGLTGHDGTLVAVGDHATILSSTDGISWAAQQTTVESNLRDVRYIPKKHGSDALDPDRSHYWAVGDDGTILWSNDAASWMKDQTPFSGNIHAVREWDRDYTIAVVAFAEGIMLVRTYL